MLKPYECCLNQYLEFVKVQISAKRNHIDFIVINNASYPRRILVQMYVETITSTCHTLKLRLKKTEEMMQSKKFDIQKSKDSKVIQRVKERIGESINLNKNQAPQ